MDLLHLPEEQRVTRRDEVFGEVVERRVELGLLDDAPQHVAEGRPRLLAVEILLGEARRQAPAQLGVLERDPRHRLEQEIGPARREHAEGDVAAVAVGAGGVVHHPARHVDHVPRLQVELHRQLARLVAVGREVLAAEGPLDRRVVDAQCLVPSICRTKTSWVS